MIRASVYPPVSLTAKGFVGKLSAQHWPSTKAIVNSEAYESDCAELDIPHINACFVTRTKRLHFRHKTGEICF